MRAVTHTLRRAVRVSQGAQPATPYRGTETQGIEDLAEFRGLGFALRHDQLRVCLGAMGA